MYFSTSRQTITRKGYFYYEDYEAFPLITAAATLIFSNLSAQTLGDTTSQQVCMYVEQMPEFPGGNSALQEYLSKSIHYPDSAWIRSVEGRVLVQFIVNEDGRISDAVVQCGVNRWIDDEALRVVSLMPAWNPGKQNGKAVKVRYVLPVTFTLPYSH